MKRGEELEFLLPRAGGTETSAILRFGADRGMAEQFKRNRRAHPLFEQSGTTTWNWARKPLRGRRAGRLAIAAVHAGRVEGMALCCDGVGRGEGNIGKPLVEVEYIEAGPWNIYEPRVFKGVGVYLLAGATALSLSRGCSGRLGLHDGSIKPGFYEKCGFQIVVPFDPAERLPWLELDEEPAGLLNAALRLTGQMP